MIGQYENSAIPLGPVTGNIATMLLERAIEWPDHPVYANRSQDGEYVPISWQTLLKHVVGVSTYLTNLGIGSGERIAVFSPNCYEMLVWELAVASMGAISVPIFAGYDTRHVDYVLQHATPVAMLINGADRLAKVEACANWGVLRTVVTVDTSSYTSFRICLEGGSPELFFRRAKEVPLDEVCIIQYTSGTTGNPKGVMLTHRNIISQRLALNKIWHISHQSRFLSYLPWHHSFGGLFERFTALYHGATIYQEDSHGKDLNRLLQNWSIVKPTQFFSVPKIFMELVTEARLSPEIKETLFHRDLKFVFTAAAPLPKDCGEYFKAQGVPVLEGWGLTETSPCVTMTPPGTERVHSYVGKPIPGCEIMTTEEGEILAKGPNIMKGYFKDPQRTAEAIDHYGWLHTGDLGEITDYGLRMICRVDGMFKLSNGEKVSSMEIENILTLSSKWIAQAVTLGAGEHFVAALIFPNFKALGNWAGKQGRSLPEGMDLALDKDVRELISNEILDNISDVQPKYQRVKAFVIIPKELTIEENELTPTMKVVRHFVLEKYHDLVGAIYRPSKHPDKLAYVVRLPGGNHAVSKKVS